jgi:hypothetical protein
MTPLAKERAPRPAPAVVIPPLPQRAPLAAAPNVSRETVAAPRVDPLPTSPRPARRPSTLEQECRAEYDRYILAMFDRAQLEVNSMFYPGARADGCKYSAWELFTHRKTVIAKWGSEELLSFFSFNRRLSYAQFREQWRDGQRSERPELQEVS